MKRSVFPACRRPHAVPGFGSHRICVASSRLIDAVVATLAFSSLSLTLAAAFTLLSIGVGMAMPG